MSEFDDDFALLGYPAVLDRFKTTVAVVFKTRADAATVATVDAVISDVDDVRDADDMDVVREHVRTVEIATAQTPAFTPDPETHYVTVGSDDYSIVSIQSTPTVHVCSIRRGKNRFVGSHGQGG